MAVFKKENKIRKMEQRIKVYQATNEKKANRLRGKLAALRSRKDY